MELTLDDIHFGTCPVVAVEGYRTFVMCYLRQVRSRVEAGEAGTEGGGGQGGG